ncbi:MAG: hypothetical protein ACP5OZ_04635 [Candidatus Woesearchaeota archaeon]
METVEVWMWLVAGLLVGSMIFITAYTLMGKHIRSQEILQAKENFAMLKQIIETTCLSGIEASETKQLIFPYRTEKIYVVDEQGVEEKGKKLCIKIENEADYCEEIKLCEVKMGSIIVPEKTNLFYLVQNAIGKKNVANIEFNVKKTGLNFITVTWKRKYVS